MKKTYYMLLLVLFTSAIANAQTGWITKNVDDKLSIKFPIEPQVVTKGGFDSFVAKGKDSIGYSTTAIDMNVVAHLDEATLAQVKDNQQFADQMMLGMASKKTNYTFGEVTIGKWKTYTTYSVSAIEKNTKAILSLRMILIGTKMYTLSCAVPAGVITKNNEVFFDSAEILK